MSNVKIMAIMISTYAVTKTKIAIIGAEHDNSNNNTGIDNNNRKKITVITTIITATMKITNACNSRTTNLTTAIISSVANRPIAIRSSLW